MRSSAPSNKKIREVRRLLAKSVEALTERPHGHAAYCSYCLADEVYGEIPHGAGCPLAWLVHSMKLLLGGEA